LENGWQAVEDHCVFIRENWSGDMFTATDYCVSMSAKVFEPDNEGLQQAVHNVTNGETFWIGFNDLLIEGE
jgi:hypothetical protein